MKHILRQLTAGLLSTVLLVGLLPTQILADDVTDATLDTTTEFTLTTGEYDDYVEISDGYLSLTVSQSNGGFLIDTVEGDLMEKDDDNKYLLYPDANYDTSFTSFRVTREGEVNDYIFGRSYPTSSDVVTYIEESSKTVISTWSVDDITFVQRLTLLEEDNTRHGMVYITYGVENSGAEATVEARILMDTALGYQDYAVYELTNHVADQATDGSYTRVESEGIYEGTSYDNTFFAYNNTSDPTITAYTINAIIGDETVTPTQVAFGHWNNLAATVFDFVPNSDLTFTNPYNQQYLTADSAYALYFDAGTLEQGSIATIGTYYGVQSNVAVNEGDSVAINFTSLPETMTLNDAGDAYVSQVAGGTQGDFTVGITVENITDEDLANVAVAVYPKSYITPYDQEGTLLPNASLDDPFFVEVVDLKAGEVLPITFTFNAEISKPSDYREIEFQVYDIDGTNYNLLMEKEIGSRTAYVMCPSATADVLAFYTATPEAIYVSGMRHLYLSGENFNLLKDTTSYTVKLRPLTGGDDIIMDTSHVLMDTAENSIDLVIEDYMMPGMWQVIFDWTDVTKADTTSNSLCFTVSESLSLANRTYGVMTIEKSAVGEDNYLLKTYETEEEYAAAFPNVIDENNNVYMVFRGDFLLEYDSYDKLIGGEAVAIGDATININDCLDVDNGTVTLSITEEEGTQSINIAIDGEVYTTGARTKVWTGVCAITPFVDGDESTLLAYNYEGEVQDNIENTVANTNAITLVWPGAASGLQTLAGMMFELRYCQFGVMCTDRTVSTVDTSQHETRRIISFGAEMSPDFLVPSNFDWGNQETSTLEKAQLTLASSNYTAEQLIEVQDRYAKDQAAWEAAAGGSASLYVHDIIFGGEFIGFNTQVDVELPSYADGLPEIQGSLTLKVMNDEWAFGIEGTAEMTMFNAEASLKIESYNGIPVPDEIYLFVGGFTPGVNPDMYGVFWIRGAGGGVSDIYDTIFKPSLIPPVTLMVSGEFALFSVLSTRANLALSLRGISGDLEDLSVAEVKLVDYLGASVYWYPEIQFSAGIQVNIYDVITGTGSMALEEDQTDSSYFWEGFIGADISIPDKYPLIGGASLGNAQLGVNAEKLWGAINVLMMDAGVTYYWGGEVDFAIGKYDVPEATIAAYSTAMYSIPVYVDTETGDTLYMTMSNITPMAMDETVYGSDETKTIHTLNLGDYETGDGLVYIEYPATSEVYAQRYADQIGVSTASGSYGLNWLDNNYDADSDENATANAMFKWDEGKAYVTISFTDSAMFDTDITVTTPVASEVSTYSVIRLPGLESIQVSGDTATIAGDLEELGKVSIYAVAEDGTLYPVYIDGAVETSGVFTMTHPLNMPSGTYTYKAIGTASDESSNPIVEVAGIVYVNPNAPTDLTSASAELGGDYSIDLTVTAGGDYDGYVVTVYDEDGKEVFQGNDFTGATVAGETTVLAVGGRYASTSYLKDGAYYSATEAFDETGMLMEGYTETTLYSGVEAGKAYTVGVYGYVTDETTGIQIPTVEEKTTSITMVEPTETVVTLTAADSVKYETITTSEGAYAIDTVTTSDVIINISPEDLQNCTYSIDGEDYVSVEGTAIVLSDMEDGTHLLAFRGENASKDSVYEQYLFHVDTTAPTLMLSGPINGSFFDSTVTVAGRTDKNDSTVTIALDGVDQGAVTVDEDGNFSKTLSMDIGMAQQTITIATTDGLGNGADAVTLTMTNNLLTGDSQMGLYLDGEEITDSIVPANTNGQLSVKINAAGNILELGSTMTSNVEWSLTVIEGTAVLSPDGYLSTNEDIHATITAQVDENTTLMSVVGGTELMSTSYTVHVEDDLGNTQGTDTAYEVGATVSVTAENQSGRIFSHWTLSNLTVEDPTAQTLTFEMPYGDVTLVANYDDGISGGVVGDSDSEDDAEDGDSITYGETVTISYTPTLLASVSDMDATVMMSMLADDAATGSVELWHGESQIALIQELTDVAADQTVQIQFVVNGANFADSTVFSDGIADVFTIKYGGDDTLEASATAISLYLTKADAPTLTIPADTSKTYDGTTAFTEVELTVTDTQNGDVLTATASGTTASADVGTYTLTATDITLGGTNASYYTTPTQLAGTVSIIQSGSDIGTSLIAPASVVYGETLTITFTPEVSAISRMSLTANTAELVYGEETLATATESADGSYIFTYDTSDRKLVIGDNQFTINYGGSGNMTASTTSCTVELVAADIADETVEPIANVTYTGGALTPAVTVTGLTVGTDYTVDYTDNTNPGTATVTITGIGYYGGTATETFTIDNTVGTVTVTNGTGGGEYGAGATVTITADTPAAGMEFVGWTGNVSFADASAMTTTFTMPIGDVEVTAHYEDMVKDVASVAAQAGVAVAYGTAQSELILPATVEVTFDDNSTAEVSVAWACDSYVATTAGDYTFIGTLTMTGIDTNTANMTATVVVTVAAIATPAGSVAIEAVSADTETDISVFNVVLSSAANVKALIFQLEGVSEDAVVTVDGLGDFTATPMDVDAHVYLLAYAQSSDDQLTTQQETVAATITIVDGAGAAITLVDVAVSNPLGEVGTQPATVTVASASTQEIFQLVTAKEKKIAEIEEAYANYTQSDYLTEQWDELTALFADAIADVTALTTIQAVEDYQLTDLITAADEILRNSYDLNGDGYVTYSDITCITPYYGHSYSEENSKYDVSGDKAINSADYLTIYQNLDA